MRKIIILIFLCFLTIEASEIKHNLGIIYEKDLNHNSLEKLKIEVNSMLGINDKFIFKEKKLGDDLSDVEILIVLKKISDENLFKNISKKLIAVSELKTNKENLIYLNTRNLNNDLEEIKKALNYKKVVTINDYQKISDESYSTKDYIEKNIDIPALIDFNDIKNKEKLIKYLEDKKIAFFSYGKNEKASAYFEYDDNSDKIARKITFLVKKILLNKKIELKDKEFLLKKELIINIENIKKYDVKLNWDNFINYKTINEEKGVNKITLQEAIKESIDKNLDIIVELKNKEISQKEIDKAWNKYFPKLDASLTGILIDEDRAKSSFGLFPQKSITGKLILKQLIFAEKANLNINIKKKTSSITKYNIEKIKKNIALETAELYLNILRAKTFEKVQESNLNLSIKHLNIAKSKIKIGTGLVSDVYRWKTQISLDKKALLKAKSTVKIAKMALLRLLHRDIKNNISVYDESLVNDYYLEKYKNITDKITRNEEQNLLNKLVKFTLRNSVELKQLNALKNIHSRHLKSIKRSFFMPIVGLQAELGYRFWSESPEIDIALPPPYDQYLPILKSFIPKKDDLDWSIGVNLTIPLFDNNERFSDMKVSKLKISKIKLQEESAKTKLEQRILTMFTRARASLSSINLAKEASKSASQGLKLVQDLYVKGAISISELIDVQNNELLAKKLLINSKYEFIIDIFNVKRALGIDFNENKNIIYDIIKNNSMEEK